MQVTKDEGQRLFLVAGMCCSRASACVPCLGTCSFLGLPCSLKYNFPLGWSHPAIYHARTLTCTVLASLQLSDDFPFLLLFLSLLLADIANKH